ncbi:hypothetical protein MCC01953_03260 [Bifidobacteriaceae bacterium MCC01953]|nr:hypothetical protein MCC01953_03260 [Bifidobacteriaceae bacterium MCC01953]
MGETTVGHVAGEVVRALYGAGYMESTIGQYRKSIRALERYAGGVFLQIGVHSMGTIFQQYRRLVSSRNCVVGSAAFFLVIWS